MTNITRFTTEIQSIGGKDHLLISQTTTSPARGSHKQSKVLDIHDNKGVRVYKNGFFAAIQRFFGQTVSIKPNRTKKQSNTVNKLSLGSYIVRTLTGDINASNDKRVCKAAFKAFKAFSKTHPRKKGPSRIQRAFTRHLLYISSGPLPIASADSTPSLLSQRALEKDWQTRLFRAYSNTERL